MRKAKRKRLARARRLRRAALWAACPAHDVDLKKIAAIYYASDELLGGADGLAAFAVRATREELAAFVDRAFAMAVDT